MDLSIVDHPFTLFAVTFALLCLCALAGSSIRAGAAARSHAREELMTVLAASLTLLGLIIGFSFSMAISRYDLRNENEEAEASAIQTEYLRADLIPAQDGKRMRALLVQYLRQRIIFFTVRDADQLRDSYAQTARLQQDLWSGLQAAVGAQPDPIRALVVSGMNAVFDSEGFTEASWLNRIPTAAWTLLTLIAILCNGVLGFAARDLKGRFVFIILPLLIATAFFLIADIDSPRGGGVIHVLPNNLIALTGRVR